jgi:hypothetical protein
VRAAQVQLATIDAVNVARGQLGTSRLRGCLRITPGPCVIIKSRAHGIYPVLFIFYSSGLLFICIDANDRCCYVCRYVSERGMEDVGPQS